MDRMQCSGVFFSFWFDCTVCAHAHACECMYIAFYCHVSCLQVCAYVCVAGYFAACSVQSSTNVMFLYTLSGSRAWYYLHTYVYGYGGADTAIVLQYLVWYSVYCKC